MNKILLTLCILSLTFLSACVADTEPVNEISDTENTPLHITLLLSGSKSTRALTTEGEGSDEHPSEPLVTDALVLLFEPNESGELSGDSKLAHLIKAENPVELTETKYTFDFRFEVDPETEKPELVAVILANGCSRYEEISELTAPTYQDLCDVLKMEFSERETEIAASAIGEHFTLWGIATRTIDTSLLTQTLKVDLIRDLAKTSVVLDSELMEETGHSLTGVLVYNRFDTFRLFPDVQSENSPILPSIPEDSSKTEEPTIAGASDSGGMASIFHPEQDILMGSTTGDVSDDNKFDRPALIIGVNWKGSGKVYYYRVDYKENDLLIDVKRNHHYLVNIKDIKGPGADTPEKAYHTLSTAVEAVVTPWTDMESDVEIDGDNWIAMERTVMLAPNEGSEASLTYSTNVSPDLWEMAWGEAGSDWENLSFSDDDEIISEDGVFSVIKKETLNFKALTSLPEGMESRAHQLYINITPRLRMVINVVQSSPTSSGNMTNWNDQNIFGEI